MRGEGRLVNVVMVGRANLLLDRLGLNRCRSAAVVVGSRIAGISSKSVA